MFTKIIRSNHFTIILSILLAASLWLFVVGDNLFQISPQRKVLENVPLVYINLADNAAVTGLDSHKNVSVVLEGLPEVLHDIDSDDLVAFIDLKERGSGEHTLEVIINPPEGLSVVSYLPSEVEVTILKKY